MKSIHTSINQVKDFPFHIYIYMHNNWIGKNIGRI